MYFVAAPLGAASLVLADHCGVSDCFLMEIDKDVAWRGLRCIYLFKRTIV
jgi:hypothetical protein